MALAHHVRRSVPIVLLSLSGFILGCSGDQGGRGVTPPSKEVSKQIAEETKAAQQERMKAMRSQMKGKGAR